MKKNTFLSERRKQLIQRDKRDNAVLIRQGISAAKHIINIISAAIKHRLFAGNKLGRFDFAIDMNVEEGEIF